MSDRMDEFRSRVSEVHLPRAVRETVLASARAGAAEAGQGAAPGPHASSHGVPRALTRRTALRLGGIAAAFAVTAAGLSLWGRGNGAGEDGSDGSGGLGNPADSPFALVAYAQGVPQADGSVLATGFMGQLGSVSGPPYYGNGYETEWSVAHQLDLRCQGEGIQDVTYQLEGTGAGTSVRFESLYQDRGSIGEGETIPSDGTDTSFTVHMAEAGLHGEHGDQDTAFLRTVRVSFPTDDTLDDLCYQERQLWAEDTEAQAEDQFVETLSVDAKLNAQLERRVAEAMGTVTLHVTATFANGSAQEQRYAVVTCDGFEDKLQAFVDAAPTAPGDTRSERTGNALRLPDDLFALRAVG